MRFGLGIPRAWSEIRTCTAGKPQTVQQAWSCFSHVTRTAIRHAPSSLVLQSLCGVLGLHSPRQVRTQTGTRGVNVHACSRARQSRAACDTHGQGASLRRLRRRDGCGTRSAQRAEVLSPAPRLESPDTHTHTPAALHPASGCLLRPRAKPRRAATTPPMQLMQAAAHHKLGPGRTVGVVTARHRALSIAARPARGTTWPGDAPRLAREHTRRGPFGGRGGPTFFERGSDTPE